MIKNTVVRLTLGYLAIIMAISLLFSVFIYQLSAREVGRGLRRGFDVVVESHGTAMLAPDAAIGAGGAAGSVEIGPNGPRFETFRTAQINDSSHRLKTQLVLLNLTVLAGAALVSYWLARRHIDPIHEAMEAQTRFTSDAAHELRTPLTVMKTEIEVGLRDKKLSAQDAKALLTSNLEEVNKLTTLTNALLRLANTSDGNSKTHWKNVQLKKLVLDAADQYAALAKEHQVSIDTSDVGNVKVQGDDEQLREMIIILLDNAFKYGRDGMSIRLGTRLLNGQAEITVTDQGIGIKASDITHIFERFYRADQSRSNLNVPGYGLGLSLAKAIAQQHGGTITAHSELGVGTTFVIHMPAVLSKVSEK